MIVTHKISMDLVRQAIQPHVNVVQGDQYSRVLELTLYSGGLAWEIPEDATAIVRYRKSDGVGGEYDTLPDGTTAYSVAGNVLTVILAPQVLTTAGFAQLSVMLIRGDDLLSTFSLTLNVKPKVNADTLESEEYKNVLGFVPAPASAEVGQYFRVSSVDENGKVTGVEAVNAPEGGGSVSVDTTLSVEGQAADAKAVGDKLNELEGKIPEDVSYTLPVATSEVLGGVKPVTATEDMTQPVGVDADGALFTAPGGGDEWSVVIDETISITEAVSSISVSLGRTDPIKMYALEIVLPITESVIKFLVYLNGVSINYLNSLNTSTSSAVYYYAYGDIRLPFCFSTQRNWSLVSSGHATTFMVNNNGHNAPQDGSGVLRIVDGSSAENFVGEITIKLAVKY